MEGNLLQTKVVNSISISTTRFQTVLNRPVENDIKVSIINAEEHCDGTEVDEIIIKPEIDQYIETDEEQGEEEDDYADVEDVPVVYGSTKLTEQDQICVSQPPLSTESRPLLDSDSRADGAECSDGEGEGEGLQLVPVKTELVESENESQECGDPIEVDNNSNIKVEPLEESYEDRLNMFLKVVPKLYTVNGNQCEDKYKDNESEAEDGSTHFLVEVKCKSKRKQRSNLSLKCRKCSTMFKYQSTYDYHVKSLCGMMMIADDSLVKKEKNQAFTCNVCHKVMCSRTSLMVHMRIHNGERPFVCDVCNRSFTQKAHLKDHTKIHIDGKPHPPVITCSECGELFTAKKYLHAHMQVHFGDKLFDCNVCHKRFRTRANLTNHKIVHSGTKDFSCTICGREFLRKPGLDDHMRTHTKEKPFACDICGKTFAEKGRRNTHVKRHTGELTQVCNICDKKFACAYDLRVHQRMHTGEKPYSCNICGRMFNRKAIMETHMTIHTGRKDFVCKQCGEAFNRKSKLDVHMATHEGETFTCEICQRVFKCKAYLVPHIRTHYGFRRKRKIRSRSEQCPFCLKYFPTNDLPDHLVQAHTQLSPSDIPHTVFVDVNSVHD